MTTKLFYPTPTKAHLLVVGSIAPSESMQEMFKAHGYRFIPSRPLTVELRSVIFDCDIVIFDVTKESADDLRTIEEIQSVIGISDVRPRVLCFSTAHRNSEFVLRIEKSGAKYIRVDGLRMLMEAVDLLLAEMNYLERNGPCFEIVHRFSQGTCAPGEEIAAVFLADGGSFFQLPLSLSQRLLFDFLSRHRRIALDSLQIISSLSGDWFYCDHASNSGVRQLKKVRRAAVKVLVQRIRDAMESTFQKTQLRFNAKDVLRSCLAEGSKRVLYKLQAEVRWSHPSR